MILRRLRFIGAYRRAARLERAQVLAALEQAQAAADHVLAELDAHILQGRVDRSAEVLRRSLLKAYRDRDEHGPADTLDAAIAAAELALLTLAADPPADRKDPHARRRPQE